MSENLITLLSSHAIFFTNFVMLSSFHFGLLLYQLLQWMLNGTESTCVAFDLTTSCCLWTVRVILAGILDKGIQIDGLGMKSFMTYESNVLFVLRFMIDCNIVGGNWIEVPAYKYQKSAKSLSYSQFEFDCLYPHLSNDSDNAL